MWPDGKAQARNVYAKTREESEEKLKVLIVEMKNEFAAIEESDNLDGIPGRISKKKKAIIANMGENPQVTNKAQIAKESGASRWTVFNSM